MNPYLSGLLGLIGGAALLYLWQVSQHKNSLARWISWTAKTMEVPRDSIEGAMDLIAAGCPVELAVDRCALAFNRRGADYASPKYIPEMDATTQEVRLNWVDGRSSTIIRIVADEKECRKALAMWLAEMSLIDGPLERVHSSRARAAIQRLRQESITARAKAELLKRNEVKVVVNCYTVAEHFAGQLNGCTLRDVTNLEAVAYFEIPEPSDASFGGQTATA